MQLRKNYVYGIPFFKPNLAGQHTKETTFVTTHFKTRGFQTEEKLMPLKNKSCKKFLGVKIFRNPIFQYLFTLQPQISNCFKPILKLNQMKSEKSTINSTAH